MTDRVHVTGTMAAEGGDSVGAAPVFGLGGRIQGIHHVAIIASDYERSKQFYVNVLGLAVLAEHYRPARQSYKLDLALPSGEQIELFSFPSPPPRPSRPESCGLRHLAFEVRDLSGAVSHLQRHGVVVEPIRVDDYTGRRFTFFADPDGLPLELYESGTRLSTG